MEQDFEGTELGPRYVVVQSKHTNGSAKIVWTWAVGMSGLVCAIIGVVALHFASEQSATNQRVADALTELKVQVASLEAKLNTLEGRR